MSEASRRSMRFMRATNLPPSATAAEPIVVDAKDAARCTPLVECVDGWWRADIVFDGQLRHIGRFGSEIQARRVAGRWAAALLGENAPPPRRRGEAGKPGAA